MKNLLLKENSGDPRVEETERKTQDENVVERVVDGVGKRRTKSDAGGLAEPFGEGANIGSEEGVDGVGEGVVRTEPSIGEAGESQARTHGVD